MSTRRRVDIQLKTVRKNKGYLQLKNKRRIHIHGETF